MKPIPLKTALVMVMWSAVTPAFLILERNTGISWPVVVISGALMWLCSLMLVFGVWAMYRTIGNRDQLAIYEMFIRTDSIPTYNPVTWVLSFLLTTITTVVMYTHEHAVIAVVGFIVLVLSICIRVGRMVLRRKFYAMSWERRDEIKKHFDDIKVRREQMEARVNALAKSPNT